MKFDLFYTLHVSLSGSDPLIWRRIEVPGVCPLNELGSFVMRSMDWDGSHLWEFLIAGKRYRDEEERYPWLQDVAEEGDSFTWVYDFGDHWLHDIRVEQVESKPDAPWSCLILEGERRCPPDDFGGIHAWQEYVKHWRDPEHGTTKIMAEWYDEPPDPGAFDLEEDFAHLRYEARHSIGLPFAGEAPDLGYSGAGVPVSTIARILMDAERWKPLLFESLRRLRLYPEAGGKRLPTVILYLLAGMRAQDTEGRVTGLLTLDRERLDELFPYLEDSELEWGRLLALVSVGLDDRLIALLSDSGLRPYQRAAIKWALALRIREMEAAEVERVLEGLSVQDRGDVESMNEELPGDEFGAIEDVAEELSLVLGMDLEMEPLGFAEEKRSPLLPLGEDRDYVVMNRGPIRREGPKVGRNDPCPCGSGKKYKKCCGR